MSAPSYIWRPVTESDLSTLDKLESACTHADGPKSVAAPAYTDLLGAAGTSCIGAVAESGSGDSIVAVGWVQVTQAQGRIGGKVHPGYRHQGLGTSIIRWAEAEAANASTLIIRNETFNEGSAALYAAQGYHCDFVEAWMMRDLHEPLPAISQSFTKVQWTTENSPQFFEVYQDAFKERPGFPNLNAEQWIADNAEDEDFRPEFSLLAMENDIAVGFVTTGVMHIADLDQTVGWISQVGVRPAWRGHGVAAALLTTVMDTHRAEGMSAIGLHVNVNNPGATRVYERLGFKPCGQRAKYSKNRA